VKFQKLREAFVVETHVLTVEKRRENKRSKMHAKKHLDLIFLFLIYSNAI
jgi:hypothetical protein